MFIFHSTRWLCRALVVKTLGGGGGVQGVDTTVGEIVDLPYLATVVFTPQGAVQIDNKM